MSQIWLMIAVFYPIVAAVIGYLIGRKSKEARNYFVMAVGISEFILVLLCALKLQGQEYLLDGFASVGLHFSMDGFRGVYGTIAALMWMMTLIFSREYFTHYRSRNRYYLFQLLTLGATVGVFFSANLFTTFIFFEIASFTSYVWVAQDERPGSLRAAETYLAVAVIGGMVLLMGLFLLFNAVGTLEISALPAACAAYGDKKLLFAAGVCMLFGFGAKAGMFPLHIWLPKAHPVAPAPASALLSGILTKLGVYGILIVSCYMFYGNGDWGMLILVIALITMFGGALLAVFSTDLKRTLACSSMSQIGFILIGVGMQCMLGKENGLAVHGTVLHMANHSLIKLVLFMVAGVVYMNLHALNLNDIRGFGRKKPFLNVAFLMGLLGIGGIPLWNGYISKTLLHEAIVEYGGSGFFKFAEWVFLISGGLTLAYMLKLYISLFWEKNTDAAKQARFDEMSKGYMNWQSKFAIGGSMILLPIMGMLPYKTMVKIAEASQSFMLMEEEGHTVHFFNLTNLKGAGISIVIGLIVYFFIIRTVFLKKEANNAAGTYVDLWPKWLDLENLIYRPLLLKVLAPLGVFFCRIGDSLVDTIVVILRKTLYRDCKIKFHSGDMPRREEISGRFLDRIAARKNAQRIAAQGAAGSEYEDEAFAEDEYEEKIRNRRIRNRQAEEVRAASQSYGFLAAGAGLLVILVYIIVL